MSTWAARYVRLNDRARDAARLGSQLGAGVPVLDDGQSPFVGWLVPSPDLEPDDLSALSRDFGEAMSLTVQTVADLVLFDRFVAGARVRGLTYAGEAGWTRVVGTPEPWEAGTLFSDAKREELERELEEELTPDVLERERAELARLWTAGRLEEGMARPPVEPAVLVRAIERHYALPARTRG